MMTDLADIFAPRAGEAQTDPQTARDVEAFLRASRVLLDLLDEEAKRGSRSARRARRINPDLIVTARETWAAAGRVRPAIETLSEDEPERSWAALAAVFRVLGPRCPPDQLPRLTVELYEAAEAVRHLQARDKGRAARASGAEERAAKKAALVQAVRRIAGELPPSPYRKTKSARALHIRERLNREAARGDAGHPGFKGTPRAFVNFCARNCIDI